MCYIASLYCTYVHLVGATVPGPAEQVRQTRQLLDQSYRNPQLIFFHYLLIATLIVLAN